MEGAIVAPLFFALLFMVFEGAFLLRSYMGVSRATDEAQRTLTVAAKDANADYRTLQSAVASLGGLDQNRVDYVIVYKASKLGESAPAACRTGSVAGLCNRYSPSDLALDESRFGCGVGSADAAWCPTSRKVGLKAGPNGPPDMVGVEVSFRHQSLVGLFFSTLNIASHSVGRIEPQTA